ncbi:uncharacterized protein PHACADRAFT_132349 [Phanerochaete carnosa HHB-10118-sp]|uniref:DUF605-domain-containing protein n=1 Tax=Phanerochaete carnosa (strain HHB-10118-sp) TaxID=650164 RepID=K5WEA4_PHACS|nr:uncharacterized protein PHACADRAFT_132349 [Phanerochaete carnosa HHB-10118-sp]EKM48512.1 hypothetical protein PHACADRAFT_132349 [Phanerochaete carnosa HHB-10118-sp]
MSLLSLPPVPPELKTVTPFLQRAEELKTKDPVIAYWCAYYAAQAGISHKLKDNAARMFLLHLLETLEKMKADIGQNDVIDDESVSSAYVENFALRVFAAADGEDRKGNATRTTAKKFLAAANFLEVLSVFNSSTDAPATTINVPEKIRYAKWKAADIAKAFREGRKPTPGGADEVQTTAEETPPAASPELYDARPSSVSPPAIHRYTPPPGFITDMPPVTPPSDSLTVPFADPRDGLTSPGAWSTIATPGTPGQAFPTSTPSVDDISPKGSALRKAWVSEELEGKSEEEIDQQAAVDNSALGSLTPPSSESKGVRFSPSVIGGLTPSAVEPTADPFTPSETPYGLPPGFPSAPPPPPPFVPSHSISFPPPPLPILSQQPAHIPQTAEATITPAAEELTPLVVARIQKHCKFAISALDYEDPDTARKELRAALRMLGG